MTQPRNGRDSGTLFANLLANRRNEGLAEANPSLNSRAKVGLLTRTLIPSPIIQWILPARLRSKLQNDVVFVGERSLQIKEAVSGVHLETVTSKTDFDANIMAAKVINVSAELPWEAQMKLESGTDLPKDLPPQILVLSLASRELVFLYFSNMEGRFVHCHRPLPNDVSTFERFGRNIAVEPRSRAVAVSASCDYFGVFVLRKTPELQAQMSVDELDPVAEERFFRVDGDILFMEFLYPKSEDAGKIILLLLVAQDQLTHAICYEWDANETFRHATPKITKRLLAFEDRLPTMLIPLTKTSSFMLITTTSMAIYKNRLDPRRQPSRYPLPTPDSESQRAPLWTRWARPLRNWLYNQKHDDIYLCREDGKISYLGIGSEGEVENQTHLGQLCCDVDAAFDILDIGHEGGDLLLAAGNTGDGGLFIQKARDHPRCVQKFMNWTPVTDSVIVRPSAQDQSSTNIPEDRMFVCSASSFGRGAVVELRHGIEAQIGLVISLEDTFSMGDIWTMVDGMDGGIFVLTSDPVSSTLLHLPADFGDEISAIDEADSGLDFGAQTLAAACTSSGVVIQVTDKTIYLGAIAEPAANCRFDYGPDQAIAVAAVSTRASLIATAVRTRNEMHLYLKRLTAADDPQLGLVDVGQPLRFLDEPVCMSIETFDIGSFIFIGSGNGKISVYRVQETVSFLLEIPIDLELGEDISKAVESLAIVTVAADGPVQRHMVLCGLRSGILVPIELGLDPNSTTAPIVLEQALPQRLGHTSVKVQSRGNFALLTCGHGFWEMSCIQSSGRSDCILQKIWITDQNNPAYHPKSVHSFALTTITDPETGSLSDSLFCIADGQVLICTLDHEAKTVPRRIDLPGSANRLAYSPHLRSLIVSYTRTEYDTESDPIQRYTRPCIEFVDPDSQQSVVDILEAPESEPRPWRPQGTAGEKISCILDWTPRKGNEEYHMIVIGTARKNQPDRGRVIFLQASRSSSLSNPAHIECTVKYIHKFEGPVYSIAPYGDSTLIVCTGHEIVPLEPKSSQTRWVRAARFPVLSPAMSITTREPYVYVSASRESLMVLKATDDRLALHAFDRQKHDGLSHIHLDGEMKLILASSRGGRVSILTEDGVAGNDKVMPMALCEAHLPSSVMKLASGSSRSVLSPESRVYYGTAMNGTVYSFSTLGEKEWRLLHLLQDLCARDPVICPFTPKRKQQRHPVGHEPLDFRPSQMHIDGDILARLVPHGSNRLRHMLMSGSSSPDTTSHGETWTRFNEFTMAVLGNEMSPVDAVLGWLKKILHVEF